MNKNRLEAFSDGVFAIAITILILEIKIPSVPSSELLAALIQEFPKFLSYVLSFFIIGVYWIAHHTWVHSLETVDRNILWLNVLNLLFVVFIPFPTALLGSYPFSQTAIVLYACTLCCVNFSGFLFWRYVTSDRHNAKAVNPKYRRFGIVMTLWPIGLYLIAIGSSWFNMEISYAIFILVPLFYILPNPILLNAPKRYSV